MNLKNAIKTYLNLLESNRLKAPSTIKSYKSDLLQAQIFFGSEILVEDISTSKVLSWLRDLSQKKIAGRSINRKLSSLRIFFSHFLALNLIDLNPALGIRSLKTVDRLPSCVSAEEIKTLLDNNIENGDKKNVRDKALFELIYSAALRLSEALDLNVSCISNNEVRVKGKGGKERIVPIGKCALKAIDRWISIRKYFPNSNIELALFLSHRGKRLSTRTAQHRLKIMAEKSGLLQHVHPHMLRHSAATHFLEGSRDLRAVQDYLGHTSITTTQIYTHLDFQHLAKIYDQSHPRAIRKKSDVC